ncbi:peptidase [Rhodobacteraceae bacterium 2CG4]|uniref:Peptidase n=1 Tax=Halovulum marinum TaxID=2662447 RepID=A0A6L5Z527_9RHOB|nr:peptidase [Halovulum marinum]MSU91656.1 peptidase [Halovulum marinum]
MTYCVGLLLNAGMVFLADTRTNAGIDNIATYRKQFVFCEPGERIIVIQTAGSLSVTQTVIAKLTEAIEDPESGPDSSILQAPTMLRVAEMVGQTLSDVSADISAKVSRMTQAASASMIVGGQRRGGAQRLFMLYPEGNFIEATEDTPYLQIGEHKYGKPILDRVVTPDTSLEDARKVALLSMDSTLRSNLSVGMPLDLLVVHRDACAIAEQTRIEAGDADFLAMSEAWSSALRDSFKAVP